MKTDQQTRKIVRIDEDKCNGCGLCVPSCAEGAIQIIDGKARLVADNLCDGLGNCLGTCPRDAITIEERPAEDFDLAAVGEHVHAKPISPSRQQKDDAHSHHGGGCPGHALRRFAQRDSTPKPLAGAGAPSRLGHWPVQLTLLPETGDIWQGADVLLAADCVAYAMGDFHERLLAGKTLAVACPKLDDAESYVAKLARIFAGNDIRSLTVARMEVPCCAGLTEIVRRALYQAGRDDLKIQEIILSIQGQILSNQTTA